MDQSTKDAPETSFAEAFEASLNFKTPEQGELLRGTIVSISGDDAYISYGGPSEAVMATAELEGKDVGETIEGVVVTTSPSIRISYKLAAGKASALALRQAYESHLPVEGKVSGRNKGGFDVNFSGVRAFCPLSQIDLGKIENPDAYIGQTLEFRITEFADDGKKFVVSRAALLREQAAARAQETRKAIAPGAVLTGRVRTIMPFGAFVDLGGIDGLLHVSEMSRRRINDPKDAVSIGQEVTVKIIKVEQEGKRISLSMKEFEKDPWAEVSERYQPGAQFNGRIARRTDFGFFVELEPGVDGLLHVSQLPPGMKPTDETLAIGSTINGWIREVDPAKRRISLALREVSTTNPWDEVETRYSVGRVVEGTVERAAQPGVFVSLEPGLTGLIPVSEMNIPAGSDPAKVHHPGQRVQVKILSVDPERKRIALSHEGAKEALDRGEYLKYQEEAKENEGKSAMALAFERAFANKGDR
jgi:small subunit ribosomal protein S1